MARIPTYQKDTHISDLDRIIGTDGDTNDLITKNFFLGDIARYVIDKFIEPDATSFTIPVFRDTQDVLGSNATHITGSIMQQDTNPFDMGLVPTGNRIKVDGSISAKDSLTINYIDGTYPRPFPPYITSGEFNTTPTGRVGVINNQDSLEWAFSAVSLDYGQDNVNTNRSGLLHGAQNDYKLSLSNGEGENTVFLNSGGYSFIKGSLGIGTDYPLADLDVNGVIKASVGIQTPRVKDYDAQDYLIINRARFFDNSNICNTEYEDIGATLHLRTDLHIDPNGNGQDETLIGQSVIAITRGGQGAQFPSGITQNNNGDYTFLLRDRNNIARIKFTTVGGDALIDDGRIVLCGNSTNKNGAITIDGRKWTNGERSAVMKFYKSGLQSDSALEFYSNGNLRGSISYSDTGTSYNVASDYRLKENVVEIIDGIERLKQLKPSKFNFISNPSKVVDGFIAHEVESVIPEAVTGEKDATEEYEITSAEYDDYGNLVSEAVMGTREAYQQIDQAKIVPLLTAALQEAVAKIEALEARIQTLEGN